MLLNNFDTLLLRSIKRESRPVGGEQRRPSIRGLLQELAHVNQALATILSGTEGVIQEHKHLSDNSKAKET